MKFAILSAMTNPETKLATFGSGCFWCSEAVYSELRGVLRVTSGYAGGTTPNPTYWSIHEDSSGHAEVIQVEFDPLVISYEQLVEVFFFTHDPTTLNRQGHDIGSEYRSLILYHDDEQRIIAERMKKKVDDDHVYSKPIVTEIVPLIQFFPAEPEQQRYYEKNPDQAYCQLVIDPKVAKFRQKFASLRK